MKKLFVIMIAGFLFVSGCGTNETAENNQSGINQEQDSQNESIEVNESLLTVDVVLPASFVAGLSEDPEELKKSLEKEEIENNQTYTLNDDGSLTITMSKAVYEESMRQYEIEIEEGFKEIIEDSNNTISKITHDSKYNEIVLTITKDTFNERISAFGVLMQVAMLRYFLGESADPIAILIDESQKEIARFSLSDIGK